MISVANLTITNIWKLILATTIQINIILSNECPPGCVAHYTVLPARLPPCALCIVTTTDVKFHLLFKALSLNAAALTTMLSVKS